MINMHISKSGRFKTGGGLQSEFVGTGAIDSGTNELITTLAKNTPVVTGLGASSWWSTEAHWWGTTLISNIENTAENKDGQRYIPIANVRSKRNHGFIQRGVAEAKARVVDAVKGKVRWLNSNLWVSK